MRLMWVRGLALCVCTALLAACANGGSPASAPAATPAPAPPSAAAAAAAQPAGSPATLHYAVVGISWASAPDIVAQEKGFYKAENLSVETVVAGQSASAGQQSRATAP